MTNLLLFILDAIALTFVVGAFVATFLLVRAYRKTVRRARVLVHELIRHAPWDVQFVRREVGQ